jgi:hypothetical protein
MVSLGLWSLYCLVLLKLSLCKDGNLYASSFMVTHFTLHIIHWLRRFCTEIARLQSGFTYAFRQMGCFIWWACWNGLICHQIIFQTINIFLFKTHMTDCIQLKRIGEPYQEHSEMDSVWALL